VDGTRSRRTKDEVRQLWYASQRRRRFARFFWGADCARAAAFSCCTIPAGKRPAPAQGSSLLAPFAVAMTER